MKGVQQEEQKAKLKKDSTLSGTKQLQKEKRSSSSSVVVAKKKKTPKKEMSPDEDEQQMKHVLLVDSEDDEIEFKTPPHAVRKSKVRPQTAPVNRSLEKSSDRKSKKRMSVTNKRPKLFQ